MEDGSSPGRRPSPDGKPSRRSSNSSHKGRKLPSPVKKEPVLQNGSQERIDISFDNEEDEIPTRDVSQELDSPVISPSKTGVAYITENLIKRLTHEDNLENITKLYLILGKDLKKKFKYIENLDNLRRLQTLHISNHMIEKIEKLDKLTQLRDLNLSRNSITKIEGLECLVRLQKLNLSGNRITQIPGGLIKKLKELQVFHIAHNKFESLLEITKLRSHQDLTEVSIEGNPMSTLAHSRQFVIFQLRSLTVLDGTDIKPDERVLADDRFGQDEIRRLETELSRQENLYDALFEEKRAVCTNLEMLTRLNSQQKEKESRQTEKIKQMQRELESKEEILASKTAELSKACEKQYKLEQELAFYKLDAKFDHLGKIPWQEGAEPEEDDEAPYIGKAGFKPNKFAFDSQSMSPAQKAQVTELKARLSDRYDNQNKMTQDEVHEALMMDLRDKELAVQRAEEQLARLEQELRRRKAQLADANDELALLHQAIGEEIKLLDDEEKRLLAAIEDKKKFIRELQDVATELAQRMDKIRDDLQRKEEELNNLNNALNATSPSDPAYEQIKTRLAALQDQLRNALKEYDNLKQDHDRTLKTLEEEMDELQRLQDELAAKRKEAEGQGKLKEELKDIIDELNDHLNSMRQKVGQQQKKIAQLQKDNEELVRELRDQQAQIGENNKLKNGIAKLQQQLQVTQDALDREKANADALRRRLSELEGQVAKGSSLEPLLADTKARLKAAEAEAAELRNALDQMKQQMKADRQAAEERIRREQEKVEKALQAAKAGFEREKQMKDLGIQVDSLKARNDELEQRLKELEDELKNSFDKDEVLDRLADLRDDIDTKKETVRQPLGRGDELGETLGDLHQRYLDLLAAMKKQGDKVDKNKVDGLIKDLNARIENLQNALKQANDHARQMEMENEDKEAQIHQLEDDLRRLKDNIARQGDMQNELVRQKAAHERRVKGLEDEIAKLRDRIKQMKNAMEQQVDNARAPLEAKIRDLEDRLDQLHDRLAKAKAEADRLKGLHDDHAAAKKGLQDEIASLADALQDANNRAQYLEDQRANDRRMFQGRIKELEDELERANERLQRALAENDDQLDRERQANADKVRGLEDELDRLRNQLRRMRQKADDDAARKRELEAQRAREMEDALAALRDELQKAKITSGDQLGKAERRNAALQTLLDQQNQALQENARRDRVHQARVQGLQDQIDELRKMLKDAENQVLKDKYEKDLDALRADQRSMAAQASAAKELADAQKQIARLQAFLAGRDEQLQEQLKKAARDDPLLATQREEISNLASALSQQNAELDRLKQDLSRLKRSPGGQVFAGPHGPTLPSLADEIDALRAALHDRERQIEALTQGYQVGITPGQMTRATGLERTGIATTPGVLSNGLVNSQGEIHHHHHFKKSGKGGNRSKGTTVPNMEVPGSPTVLGASVVSPGAYGASVHHHHYDGVPEDKTKRRRKKEKMDDLFCNVPEHGDLDYEVGLLEGILTSTQQHSAQDQRDSLRNDLQNLEDEVQGALRNRAVNKRNQQHSLDATLASGNQRVQTQTDVPAQVQTGHVIPPHYLQPSETRVSDTNYQGFPAQFPSSTDLQARRDYQVNELTLVENLLRTRRMELQEVTASLSDRRLELENVVEQFKRGEERFRHAEDDANHIEQRASKTSNELIKAGNQLLSLELRSRTMMDKIEHLNLETEEKTKRLAEKEQKCHEVTKKLEKMNEKMEDKKEEVEKTEKKMKEVQERLKLTLRLEELREIITKTEKDELLKSEQRLNALKDGEKILVQRTSELARTRNELQKQTTEYHQLNADITRARKDLNQLEAAVKKNHIEMEDLAARKEEERAYHETVLEEAKDKLDEINEARNEVLSALRKHREELLTMREKVQEENGKKTKIEKECKEKEENLNRINLQVEEKEKYLVELKDKVKGNIEELEKLRDKNEEERNKKDCIIRDVLEIKEEYKELLKSKEKTEQEMTELVKKIENLRRDLRSKQEQSADTQSTLQQAQNKIEETRTENIAVLNKRDSLLGELKDLNQTLTERTKELEAITEEKNKVSEELKQERKKFIETKKSYQEFETELKILREELEKRQEELKQEMEKEHLGEPADNGASGDHMSLRSKVKDKQDQPISTVVEGKNLGEPTVGGVSGTRSVIMRSDRQKKLRRQENERGDISEPAVREVSGKDDLIVLREELKKKREHLKTKKFVEPTASETSGKESGSRRRKRQGAKLPIPIKERRVQRGQGDCRSKVSANAHSSAKTNVQADTKLPKQSLYQDTRGQEQEMLEEVEESSSQDEEDKLAFAYQQDSNMVQLQNRVVELSNEKDKTREALKNSVLEVRRLKTQIQTEKEKSHHSLRKATSEAKDYRRALEHAQKEHAQYQLRASRELEYLRSEATEQYKMAQKLAKEIAVYKQASLREEEKREVAESTNPTRDNMDAITTQIKSEILHSLQEIEQSREMTLRDIHDLKQTKEVIELQLVALQQSLNEVTEKTHYLQKTRNESAKEQVEEPTRQLKDKTFIRQQGFLKDQLRQQMSRRAEILEEERRKAGQSLEGLKNKLKQLEKVITRKDSAVQDFRIELAKSRVEKEKSVDMEKEMDELKRRLRDVENERDSVKTQLSHMASLGEHTGPLMAPQGFDGLQKQLEMLESKLSVIEKTRDKDDEGGQGEEQFVKRVVRQGQSLSEKKRPTPQNWELRRHKFKEDRYLLKEEILDDGEFRVFSDRPSKPTAVGSDDFETQDTLGVPVHRKQKAISSKRRKKGKYNSNDVSDNESENEMLRGRQRSWRETRDIEEGQEAGKFLQDKRKSYLVKDSVNYPSYGPLASTEKGKTTKRDDRSYEESACDLGASKSGSLSISSIADDKKTKFLASVNRLKNEKVRELEIGLQTFLKH